MKRILHVVAIMNLAGAETMIMNLFRHIDRSKYVFDFIVFNPEKGDFDDEIRSLGGRLHLINERNPLKHIFILRDFLKINPEYQIVHCHNLFSNSFHMMSARLANVPFRISHSHNTNDISKGPFITGIFQFLSKILIDKYSTHFLACGVAAGKFLFPNNSKVLVFPNSIDTERFAEVGLSNKNYIKKLFNLNDQCLVIIQVCRLSEVKNHLFSLRLASLLVERNVDFKMFFVGKGDLENSIESSISELKLSEKVIMLGSRKDIPQLMAGSDVKIMPSFYEGFPVALVEAQSVGLPCLISDQISLEVDLNVGLVDALSLAKEEEWVEKLIAVKSISKMKASERLEILKEKGFDIKASALLMTDLYDSMK